MIWRKLGWNIGKIVDKPIKITARIMVSVSCVSNMAWKKREIKLSVERENPVDSAKKYEKGISMKQKLENMKI